MRQAGIIAAAGLMALQPGPDGMIDRLAEDHVLRPPTAARDSPSTTSSTSTSSCGCQTNFVMFRVRSDEAEPARGAGPVRGRTLGGRRAHVCARRRPHLRAVTHYGIDEADIDRAIEIAPQAWRSMGAVPARV